MDRRLNHIESEISGFRHDVERRFESMERRFEGVERRFESLFKWTVGLILGMWVTVIMTLIPILLKILGVI